MRAYRAFVTELSGILRNAAGDRARNEAREIVRHITGIDSSTALLSPNTGITDSQARECRSLAARRSEGVPLQYVLGSAYFWDKEYRLTPDVLIPRPDTETLVSVVLEHEPLTPSTFLDLGVGSGVIVDTLARHRPQWTAFGVDISIRALEVARVNCVQRVGLLAGDRFSAIRSLPIFDFLVSNPPYISPKEWDSLDPEVTEYEPRPALTAERNGLAFYEYIASHSRAVLVPEGRIYCEIGYLQAESVMEILGREKWRDVRIFKDLAGRDRVVTGWH
jgi:release factor glutamine methyltransferase